MSPLNTGVFGKSQPQFWEQFESVVPEAVRCRFFSTAMRIADARAIEYRRESGPFLPAVESTHLPVAIRRLETLKKDAEALVAFYAENDLLITRAAGRVDEAFEIITKFETRIVHSLDEVVNTKDEAHAQEAVSTLRLVAAEIGRDAEDSFVRAVDELEQAVDGRAQDESVRLPLHVLSLFKTKARLPVRAAIRLARQFGAADARLPGRNYDLG